MDEELTYPELDDQDQEELAGDAARTQTAARGEDIAPVQRPTNAIQPGSGFTYATQGPGDWSRTIAKQLPDGTVVQIPANAVNFGAASGAPYQAPDKGVAAMNAMLSKLPMKGIADAQAATNMGIKFTALRQYQAMINAGVPEATAFRRLAPMLLGSGVNVNSAFGASIRSSIPKDINGVGYQMQPDGSYKAVTPAKVVPPHVVSLPRGGVATVDPSSGKMNMIRQPEAAQVPATEGQKEMARADAKTLIDQLGKLETASADIEPTKGGGWFGGPVRPNPAYFEAKKAQADLRRRIATIDPKAAVQLQEQAQEAPAPSARVRVKAKDGKVGTIPANQLDEALKAGYTKLQ